MKQAIVFIIISLGFLIIPQSQNAQTVHVRYKKFIVPGNTDYGRWVSSPEAKRKVREREEQMANNVSEFYDLYSDGKISYFEYDTTITLTELKDNRTWWSKMGEVKLSYAKDIRAGEVTIRSNILPDSLCHGFNYKQKYEWVAGEGMKVFADLECQKLQYIDEEGNKTIVWYSPSIPISDGPQDFGGAPGLILAVEAPNFNYIAEEVQVDDFPIEVQPVDLDFCLDEKEFRKQARVAMTQKYFNQQD